MESYREIIKPCCEHYSIKVPEWAIGRDIEVALSPVLDSENFVNEINARDIIEDPVDLLGYGKRFGMTGTTDEWMREMRDGEQG